MTNYSDQFRPKSFCDVGARVILRWTEGGSLSQVSLPGQVLGPLKTNHRDNHSKLQVWQAQYHLLQEEVLELI